MSCARFRPGKFYLAVSRQGQTRRLRAQPLVDLRADGHPDILAHVSSERDSHHSYPQRLANFDPNCKTGAAASLL